MIVFEKVTLQNFLSYGNDVATLNLQRKNPTLITGINHDASINGEMDSNGCGKSSLLMAITFALYDVALGKEAEKKDNLINNINKKDLLVELHFKVQKDQYIISRYRKNKAMGGNGVKIVKNGKDITPDSISNANSFIVDEIIKVPYEIFSRIITYAANEESFLNMPLAKQREVIEELFSYTELTKKAEVLKEQIKSTKIDLKYAIDSNEEIKEEYLKHKKRVEEAKCNIKEWYERQQEEIEEVKALIEQYSQFDFEKEEKLVEQIESYTKSIVDLETKINNEEKTLNHFKQEQEKFEAYDETKANRIVALEKELKEFEKFSEKELEEQLSLFEEQSVVLENIKEKNQELKKVEKAIDDGLTAIEELETEKKALENAKCPYCHQEYKDSKEKLKEVTTTLKKLSRAVKDNLENSQKIKEELDEMNSRVENITKMLHFNNPRMVENYRQNKNNKREKLEELKLEENPYSDQTEEIKTLVKKIEKIKTEIKSIKKQVPENPSFKSLKELFEAKSKLNSSIEKLNYLEKQENPYEKLLENLEKFELKEDKSKEIKKLESIIKHQEFLLKLLTKKDSFVRKALMDKYLPFLNERLRYYLNMMGLPHKAQFKSDLSMEISQFDREITFTSLSSGQKARINIALSLAFRDVLQSKHNFINLYILDECLDVGLSNAGIKKTVKLIKEVADKNKLSMFVISHRDEIKDSFKDQIEIELKNGFSKIKSP